MIVKAKCALKKSIQERVESFGKIKSFLCNFVEANVGSTASVVVKGTSSRERSYSLKPVSMPSTIQHESSRWMGVT